MALCTPTGACQKRRRTCSGTELLEANGTSILQAGRPSCHSTISVKALKTMSHTPIPYIIGHFGDEPCLCVRPSKIDTITSAIEKNVSNNL